MTDYGDIPEECKDMLQDGMTFSLNYREGSKKKDGDPMWASASSAPGDWFYADDGS